MQLLLDRPECLYIHSKIAVSVIREPAVAWCLQASCVWFCGPCGCTFFFPLPFFSISHLVPCLQVIWVRHSNIPSFFLIFVNLLVHNANKCQSQIFLYYFLSCLFPLLLPTLEVQIPWAFFYTKNTRVDSVKIKFIQYTYPFLPQHRSLFLLVSSREQSKPQNTDLTRWESGTLTDWGDEYVSWLLRPKRPAWQNVDIIINQLAGDDFRNWCINEMKTRRDAVTKWECCRFPLGWTLLLSQKYLIHMYLLFNIWPWYIHYIKTYI